MNDALILQFSLLSLKVVVDISLLSQSHEYLLFCIRCVLGVCSRSVHVGTCIFVGTFSTLLGINIRKVHQARVCHELGWRDSSYGWLICSLEVA